MAEVSNFSLNYNVRYVAHIASTRMARWHRNSPDPRPIDRGRYLGSFHIFREMPHGTPAGRWHFPMKIIKTAIGIS